MKRFNILYHFIVSELIYDTSINNLYARHDFDNQSDDELLVVNLKCELKRYIQSNRVFVQSPVPDIKQRRMICCVTDRRRVLGYRTQPYLSMHCYVVMYFVTILFISRFCKITRAVSPMPVCLRREQLFH
jgi:hypothetical protein